MEDKITHTVEAETLVIEMTTNRFTHDLVNELRNKYPLTIITNYKRVEFNLRHVKMIDSSSIGFLFDLHNKLKAHSTNVQLIIAVGDNTELKDLLHKFQVDLLLNVQ